MLSIQQRYFCMVVLGVLSCVPFVSAHETRDDLRMVAFGKSLKDIVGQRVTECSQLRILSICTDTLKANCIRSDVINAQDTCIDNLRVDNAAIGNLQVNNVCADVLHAQSICTNRVDSAHVCAQNVQAANGCFDQQRARLACANSVSTQDLCATGAVRVCSVFSARVALSGDLLYNLGDVVTFDQTLSDPLGSIAQWPTRFIVQETGTYIVTAQVNSKDLIGANTIAGTPVASLEIYVNGVLRRQVFLPYLSFNVSQSSLSTSLIFLRQGEELLVRYNVYVIDPLVGFIPYVGQVTLVGNPGFTFRSFLSVHYLSSDCETMECPPCTVECQPCNPCAPTPCTPVVVPVCQPCESCCEPCIP